MLAAHQSLARRQERAVVQTSTELRCPCFAYDLATTAPHNNPRACTALPSPSHRTQHLFSGGIVRQLAQALPRGPLPCNRWKQAVLAAFRARDVAVGAPTVPIWLTTAASSRGWSTMSAGPPSWARYVRPVIAAANSDEHAAAAASAACIAASCTSRLCHR
jgi:hypothetical protein